MRTRQVGISDEHGRRRWVGLGAYVHAWREVLAAPPDLEYRHGLTGWGPQTAARILADFRAGLHDRINKHVTAYGRGRKWDQTVYMWAWRTARAVNTPRLVVRATEVPREYRARLARRLTWPEEEF